MSTKFFINLNITNKQNNYWKVTLIFYWLLKFGVGITKLDINL